MTEPTRPPVAPLKLPPREKFMNRFKLVFLWRRDGDAQYQWIANGTGALAALCAIASAFTGHWVAVGPWVMVLGLSWWVQVLDHAGMTAARKAHEFWYELTELKRRIAEARANYQTRTLPPRDGGPTRTPGGIILPP